MVMGFREDNPAAIFLANHYIEKDMFAFVDTDGSFEVQPRDIADTIKKSVDVDENIKMQIINDCMPRANFKFPERHYLDKSRKTGMRSLYCQASWFKRYQFIAYSVKEDGVFCLPLSFFQLNLHTVSEPNVLFRNHTRTGKKFMTIFPLMKLSNIT